MGYTRDEARRLQHALAARGFAPGPIDGEIGPQTRAALSAFQQQRNAPGGGFDRQAAYELGLSDFDDSTVAAIDTSSTPRIPWACGPHLAQAGRLPWGMPEENALASCPSAGILNGWNDRISCFR